MRRLSAVRLGIALGLLACGEFFPAGVLAQQTVYRPQSKIIVYKAETESATVVGVLGQVPKPGAYQFAGAPTLQLAVDSAGGLTKTASPMVRLVRGQRVVQRVALHAAAKDVLQTGDLVIVDAQPQRHGQPAPKSDAGIQLAFLGVVDRPVIVKVHSSQARADLIVQMLGQSPDLLRHVRVIPPPNQGLEPNTTGVPRSAPQLTEGTVLLFNRQQIVEEELRDLPEIMPCSLPEPDIGAYGVRNAYEERQSNETSSTRRPGGANPRTSSPDMGILSQVPPPALEEFPNRAPTLLPDTRTPAMLSSTGSAGNATAPVTTLPFSGTAAISARASRSTELPPPLPRSTAADTQAPAWNRVADSKPSEPIDPTTAAADAEFDDATATAAGSLSIWQMLTVIASAAMLVGLALAIRSLPGFQSAANQPAKDAGIPQGSALSLQEQRRSEPGRATLPSPHIPITAFAGKTAPAVAPGRSSTVGERLELRQQRFAQLVNRELSLIEEPLAFPPGLVWSTSETGEIVRRSPSLPAGPSMKEISPSAAAATIRQIDPPHPQRVPGPHHRAAQEAPVERALRQLQGGIS